MTVPLVLAILIHWIINPLVFWPVTRVFHALRELCISARTSGWYVIQGTVVALHAKQKSPFWQVWVVYSYSAESHRYLASWRRIFIFESEVDRFMEKHPEGSEVTLRYFPGRINRPVVLEADQARRVHIEASRIQ